MDIESKAVAVGVALGRRQAAEKTAAGLRAIVARWAERIASRGVVLGPLFAGLTRHFVEDLEREAAAIEAGIAVMQAEERRLRADLEAAKVARPKASFWKWTR